MPGFFLIVFALVGVILGLSVYFLRYLAEGRRLRAARIAVAVFDLGGVSSIFFLFGMHRTNYQDRKSVV